MKTFLLILSVLCLWQKLAMAQPAFPKMDRRILWVQADTNNVATYRLTWGTNSLVVQGASNQTAVVPLQPGWQPISVNSFNSAGNPSLQADTTTALMLRLWLESAEGAAGPWVTETNWTWVISPAGSTSTNRAYRTRLDWSRVQDVPATLPMFTAAAATAPTSHSEARTRAGRRTRR